MLGEFDKQMMLKFLNRNYPVSRIKIKMRFKRGIVLESGQYLIGDEFQLKQIKFQLTETLIKIFNCDKPTSIAVLDNFLQSK